MKVNELRIGNYVSRLGKITKIEILELRRDGKGFTHTNIDGAITINQVDPIPLTEKWLLKFRFEKYKGVFRIKLDEDRYLKGYMVGKNFSHAIDEYDLTGERQIVGLVDILYVNQLQNLYFALTGNELKTI